LEKGFLVGCAAWVAFFAVCGVQVLPKSDLLLRFVSIACSNVLNHAVYVVQPHSEDGDLII
jgi:hypothetical protein